jgi:hypothetical protein
MKILRMRSKRTIMSEIDEQIYKAGLPHPNSSWFHPPEKVKLGARLSMYLLMATVTVVSVIAWIVWVISER